MKSFYRTTITVDVLSERPFDPINLAEVHDAITTGDCSGSWRVAETQDLTEQEMSQAALEQGTDPGFFGIETRNDAA